MGATAITAILMNPVVKENCRLFLALNVVLPAFAHIIVILFQCFNLAN